MGVTQKELANKLKLDVSTVNKILNEVKGPSFKLGTVQKVFRLAEKLKYNFKRPTKNRAVKILDALLAEHRCAGCSPCTDAETFLRQLGRR